MKELTARLTTAQNEDLTIKPISQTFGTHTVMQLDDNRALYRELLALAVDGGWSSARLAGTYRALTGAGIPAGWLSDGPARTVASSTKSRVAGLGNRWTQGSVNPRVIAITGTGLLGAAALSIGWVFGFAPLYIVVLIWLVIELIATASPELGFAGAVEWFE